MKTLVLSDSIKKTTYWHKLLSLVAPDAEIVCKDISELQEDLSCYELLFLYASNRNENLYKWLEKVDCSKVPAICSFEAIDEELIKAMQTHKIKGFLNEHSTLDDLAYAVRVVRGNNGSYLKFVN